MTYKEFLAKLSKTPRKWSLGDYNQLRLKGSKQCPIEAVARVERGYLRTAQCELKLSGNVTTSIQTAADGYGLPKIRLDLLKACGLKEKP